MKISDLLNDLNKLKDCELIKFEVKGDTLSLTYVLDEEEHEHEEEEDDECCFELNGHLYQLDFKGVTSLKIEGQESDNYILKDFSSTLNHLHLEYEGISFVSKNSNLLIDFDYKELSYIDLKEIKGPDC